jgi:hypothetical protein
MLARSQYSEGPATGHLGTVFYWFPCVYKQMLKWFLRFQLATTCFSCSPPDLSLLAEGFGGLVVRMLASGSRIRGFKPGRSRWIFLYIKILSMPSYGGEVK